MAADALANLARIGQLKVEARNPAEVLRMLKQAKTRLADAQLAHVSVDGRFASSYGAGHADLNRPAAAGAGASTRRRWAE
jgi:hypothetical protein